MTGRTRTAIIFACIGAALAFGLLGASAAGLTGRERHQPAASSAFRAAAPAAVDTPTPTPSDLPHLAIDADPTNGSRPCDPVDQTRLGAPTSGTYTVAVCLVDSPAPPDGVEIYIVWSGGVVTAPEVSDVGDALDDNPDFNDTAAPTGSGSNWLCTVVGAPRADDPSTPDRTDARMLCNAKGTPGTMTVNPGLIGTLTMQAQGSGLEVFDLAPESNIAAISASPPRSVLCWDPGSCPRGLVVQGDGPLITPTPSNTPTPVPTSTPAPFATPTLTPVGPYPHMAIDADTTNGSRPCDPVDTQRLGAPTSGSYTVALCLVGSFGPTDAFEAGIWWDGGVATAPEIADSGDALDDNPDFNQAPGPLGSGANWACNAFGFTYPRADPSPARIVCNNKNFTAGELTAESGLLATFTLEATGTGVETFELTRDGSSSVNSPAGNNRICGLDLPSSVSCPGAFVVQGDAEPPTFTPTPSITPTPSSTPTPDPNVCNPFSPPPPANNPGFCPTAVPPGAPFSVELSADPDEIVCDGSQASHIAVHVRSRDGTDVQDGTPVYFGTFGPATSLSSSIGTTFHGVTGTDVRAFTSPGLPFEPVRVQVDVGRIEATIRVLCLPPAPCQPCPPPCDAGSPPQPDSPPCGPLCPPPASPPGAESPPCFPATPTPQPCDVQSPPCGPFCPPPASPPGADSPPCFTPTPPTCGSQLSPPCATPTPACGDTTSPPCVPFSPPRCGGAFSPPCATPTPAVPCADVNGDHLVTGRDLILIAHHIGAKKPNLKYDVNGDGHVDARDLDFTLRQIGRRC